MAEPNKPRKNGPAPGEGGVPRKEIDFKAFEGMCRIQCTLAEIAGVLGVSEDTVETRCKEQYERTFSEVYKGLSGQGKMSLRRAQMAMAQTNPTMNIWCSKQYLGQRDMPLDDNAGNAQQAPIGRLEHRDVVVEVAVRARESERKADE